MKKRIVAIVLLSLLTIGVSAVLVQYFGRIVTTAEVEQAVKLVGSEEHLIPESAPGGESFCFLHKLKNDASVDIDVDFEMECSKDGQPDNCGGITKAVYEVPEKETLTLENKDNNWNVIADNTYATLEFDPVNPTLDYTLTVVGLQTETEYALIYYADDDPRFSNWGGDNPGAVIEIFTTDTNGDYNSVNSVDLGMNIPSLPDWNINPIPDYCDLHNGIDDYDHCKGAKSWIVKTSDLTNGNSLPLKGWNPNSYLFETDLITYLDCDEEIENFVVDMEKGNIITTLITKSRTLTPILICYGFDVAIASGTYVITTDIIP